MTCGFKHRDNEINCQKTGFNSDRKTAIFFLDQLYSARVLNGSGVNL